MKILKSWWNNDLPTGVKIVLLLLLANGLPAFIILMTLPGYTEVLFVWTIKPIINARLIGVMYGNALLLVIFSAIQTRWEHVRVNMVVITLFSVLATILTFFFLTPFMAHPWFHLAYWLIMYIALFLTAPVVFFNNEKKSGGKLPVQIPLTGYSRVITGLTSIVSLAVGSGLIFRFERVNEIWPWNLPPLVGGLIGVLFLTHAAAYAWAIWDGDWIRTRSIYWQAPATALLFILLPILHPGYLKPDPVPSLLPYFLITGSVGTAFLVIILTQRSIEKANIYV